MDIIRRPNNLGCVEIKGGWYVYRVDARGGCIFTGPFGDKAIIFACAKEMRVAKLFDEYRFSDIVLDLMDLGIDEDSALDLVRDYRSWADEHGI